MQILPKSYASRKFTKLSTNLEAKYKPDGKGIASLMKASNMLLENRVSKLATDNQFLKKQVEELEEYISKINEDASTISHKLNDLKQATFSTIVESQSGSAQEIVSTIVDELQKLMTKNDEVGKIAVALSNHEITLSRQISEIMNEKYAAVSSEEEEEEGISETRCTLTVLTCILQKHL